MWLIKWLRKFRKRQGPVAESNYLDKYVTMFEKEMGEVDPLQQVVLKGHLIIEAAIDNILSIIFFHPEHVFKGRFTFMQKVQMARAYGLRKDKNTIWNLILSINEVRNEVAHNLAGDKRDKKLKQLRRLLLIEATKEMRASFETDDRKFEDMPDEVVVTYSCSLCTGFLGAFEADIAALRSAVDALDRGRNPDQERISRKTPEEARRKTR